MHHSPLNLIVIVVETNDVAVSESTNLARRTTNTTAHIKDGRVLSDTNLCGEVVLMPKASQNQFTQSSRYWITFQWPA